MTRRLVALAFAVVALAGTSVLLASGLPGFPQTRATPPASPPSLEVHEWGTFTSVAGADGQAVPWSPLGGPSDLPCFVTTLNPSNVKVVGNWLASLRSTVRMETPVVYFYADRPQTVRVDVRFSQGLITEWYPQAVVPAPAVPVDFAATTGAATWRDVEIRPGAPAAFITEARPSHYYAARETDAAPVRVNGQDEKFLFYRGLAGFPVPLAATVEGDGAIRVTNSGPRIGTAMLVESDGRRVGYRIARGLSAEARIARPALTNDVAALASDLERALVVEGMFPREARAMIETWRDSWFEAGARLFYIVPRETVDRILPLTIDPVPAKIARAFVGRLEIFRAESLTEVARALETRDVRTLARFGRFAEPMAQIVRSQLRPGIDVTALLNEASLWQRTDQPTCR